MNSKELVALGDLNLTWLQPVSDDFRAYCDSLNLFQLVDSPTRPNIKNPGKSSLIDVILTYVPHKYSTAPIFANDISDHCVVAIVRNTKIPKTKPCILVKRFETLLRTRILALGLGLWEKICLIADVDYAWDFFYEGFNSIINKHAPLKKYRVKGHNNAWFTPDLSDLLHKRNLAWARARKSKQDFDWLVFRQTVKIRIRKAKANHFLSQTSNNLNNPTKFWKIIKSLSENNNKGVELPPCIVKNNRQG